MKEVYYKLYKKQLSAHAVSQFQLNPKMLRFDYSGEDIQKNIYDVSHTRRWIMTSNKGLCVNIIGIKETKNDNERYYFKTIHYRMHNYVYYLSLIINKFQN